MPRSRCGFARTGACHTGSNPLAAVLTGALLEDEEEPEGAVGADMPPCASRATCARLTTVVGGAQAHADGLVSGLSAGGLVWQISLLLRSWGVRAASARVHLGTS